MKLSRIFIFAIVSALALTACKTTEANYRQAYERTVAARAEQDSIEQTIYGRERRNMTERTVSTPTGDVAVRTQMVRVTENGGGIPENLRRYCVVVGQFKQLFNATSMRNRLADSSFPSAFVVETSEPYYFVVAASFSDVSQAAEELEKIKKNMKIKTKAPCPFILDATARAARKR